MFRFFRNIRKIKELILYILEDQVKWNETQMNAMRRLTMENTYSDAEWIYYVRRFDEAKIRYAESLRIYELIKKNI